MKKQTETIIEQYFKSQLEKEKLKEQKAEKRKKFWKEVEEFFCIIACIILTIIGICALSLIFYNLGYYLTPKKARQSEFTNIQFKYILPP